MNAHSDLQDERSPVDFCSSLCQLFILFGFDFHLFGLILTGTTFISDFHLVMFFMFSWASDERYFVLVIVRMAHNKFVKIHYDEHSDHGDYHCERQLALM